MSWLMNPTSQAIKNVKCNYVGLFSFWFVQKLLGFLEVFPGYLEIIFHVSRQKFVSVISVFDFHLVLFFTFIRVFFLNFMYSYEISIISVIMTYKE